MNARPTLGELQFVAHLHVHGGSSKLTGVGNLFQGKLHHQSQPHLPFQKVNVFDEFERTYDKPATHGESTFSFLNRSGRPAVELIRRQIEKWFGEYPAIGQHHLRTRLRTEFHSAFFELFLHGLFRRLGASITLHPDVGTTGKRPDFLVLSANAATLIVEATLAMDEASEQAAQRSRRGTLYDAINDMESPYFHLSVKEIAEDSQRQIASRHVVAFLERELSKLNPESVFADYAEEGSLPRLTFEEGEIRIQFEVLPKRREAWARASSRTIGMYPLQIRWGGAENSLLKALSAKAKRYGAVGEPFIIAVNCLSEWGVDKKEHRAALFGTEQEYVPAFSDQLALRRLDDGFWGTESNKKYTRVSAVILGTVFPWNVPRCDLCLYRNPWARHELLKFNWPLEQASRAEDRVEYLSGTVTPAALFDLPEDWPGTVFERK